MTDYQKLESIYAEIDTLIEKKVMSTSPEFKSWRSKAERFLINHFGDNSYEAKDFSKTVFSPAICAAGTNEPLIRACVNGLKTTQIVFQDYLKELKEDMLEKDEKPMMDAYNDSENYELHNATHQNKKIFVVHGHDEALKEKVARLVEKQGFEAIILSEQSNNGKTIIEKFEENSEVGAAICLFTGDDIGKAKSEPEEKQRARQNVVYEAGYFMRKLGREKVVMVVDKGIELPSDLQGVVYTNSNDWNVKVLQELQSMGYEVDFNKLFK